MPPTPAPPVTPVLFYDGNCGLCAASVRWCLDRDRRGVLRFAPLQGKTYAAIDTPGKPVDLETMVLLDADGLHVRGAAALRAMRHVGGIWPALARVGSLLPRALLDAGYRFIARHRIAWFGAVDSCRLPTEAQRPRFLP